MRQYFAAVFLAAAVAGCAHDTQQSIRQDAREKGQFTTPSPPDVVYRNMEAMFDKCMARRIYRTYTNASLPSRPGAVASVELLQSAPTGTRLFLLVEVRPHPTGSDVAFYKSSAYSMFSEVRPALERWASGDVTC